VYAGAEGRALGIGVGQRLGVAYAGAQAGAEASIGADGVRAV
jgi:hypothetical protein